MDVVSDRQYHNFFGGGEGEVLEKFKETAPEKTVISCTDKKKETKTTFIIM